MLDVVRADGARTVVLDEEEYPPYQGCLDVWDAWEDPYAEEGDVYDDEDWWEEDRD